MRMPVCEQKIIHPMPERFAAFFLSYNPSVVQIRVPFVIPSATHVRLSFECVPASIPSHIQVPPQVEINSQNVRDVFVSFGDLGPSWSLVTVVADISITEVGIPKGSSRMLHSSCALREIDVALVLCHPESHL
jgi:hypothetical protein